MPSVESVSRAITLQTWQETLCWLLWALGALSVPDSVLFDAVILLARYYAMLPAREVPANEQQQLLAAVVIAMKVQTRELEARGVPEIVAALQMGVRAEAKHSFESVMQMEMTMLQAFDFHVGTPTAHDVLEMLCLRDGADVPWRILAQFLLQLTLGDVSLHFGYSPGVLAASCVALALWSTCAPSADFEILQEDFAASGAGDMDSLAGCRFDIHQLWTRSVVWTPGQPLWTCTNYARFLCAKFGRAGLALAPPASPPPQITPPRNQAGRGGGA